MKLRAVHTNELCARATSVINELLGVFNAGFFVDPDAPDQRRIDLLVVAHTRRETQRRHTSIVEGSIGAIPRRLMVASKDAEPAAQLLAAARAALDTADD